MLTDLSIEIMDKYNDILREDLGIDNENSPLKDVFSPLNRNILSEILSAIILCINENFTESVRDDLLRFYAFLVMGKLKTIETEELIRKTENLTQLQKIISFRGPQIPQLEANILQEIEKLTKKRFKKVNKLEWDTKMGFLTQARHSYVICFNINIDNLFVRNRKWK